MLGLDTCKTKTIGYILVFNDRILPETDFHIFVPGGVDKYLGGGGGGGAAACFGRGVVTTPGKAKENV
jgi:hypothetical protein